MEDKDVIIKSLRNTLCQCVLENESLVRALKFYARAEDWRDIALMDRGDHARKTLQKIIRRDDNE
jgi:hypothetical protein